MMIQQQPSIGGMPGVPTRGSIPSRASTGAVPYMGAAPSPVSGYPAAGFVQPVTTLTMGRVPSTGGGVGAATQVVRLQSCKSAAEGLPQAADAPMRASGSIRTSMLLGPQTSNGACAVVQSTAGLPGIGADVEELQKTVAEQADKIAQLTKELAKAKESESKLRMEADLARDEASRLVEELRREKTAREQLEGMATRAAAAADRAPSASKEKPVAAAAAPRSASVRQRKSVNGPAMANSVSSARGARPESSAPSTARRVTEGTRSSTALGTGRRSQSPLAQSASQAGTASAANMTATKTDGKPAVAKDDIDVRLQDFVERSECNLAFKRLNKGFYTVRRPGANADHHVEVSIVNGKLMVKLESSTTEPGWNNGKLGPVEKFVAFYTSRPE
mmetsp:Transcript_6062/g.13423  ORF Transcript_6062/g.13423 Transcript_6062/m.13423 type:complete len:390 (-) Transcript_6062:142-1311(-)